MRKNQNSLSIIIVNHNSTDLLRKSLLSIGQGYEIIVVDNASTDAPQKLVKQFPKVKFIFQKENTGFARANNLGAKLSKGKYLLFLNPDTETKPSSLNSLLDFAKNTSNLGAVAPRLLNPDGSIQPSCFKFPTMSGALKELFFGKKGGFLKYAPSTESKKKIDCAVGAAVLIPRTVFEKIGGWDERYFMYYEDFELARQIKNSGLDYWYYPGSQIMHIHGASSSQIPDLSIKRLGEASKIYNGPFRHLLLKTIIQLSRFKYLLLLFLLTIPSFLALMRPGYFPMHDDLQAMRLLQMDKCVKDFQIPCRWVPDMAYGYGFPLFNYYPPLPYYLGEAIHLVGFGFLDTVKILSALGFIASGIAMFYLIRDFFGDSMAVVGAVFYVYAPYHALDLYVRGAMNEFYALIFIPAILWSSYRLLKKANDKYVLLLGISGAGLLLSHNIITMIFTPFFLLWVLIHKPSLKLIPAGLLAFGLSAFFTLPVIFESKFAHVETLTVGYFNYLAHFIDLKQMFVDRFWGYGPSFWGPDQLSFQIGHLHWILSLLAITGALMIRKTPHKKTIIYFSLVFLLSAFMAHLRSSAIWARLPLLHFAQFPWRLLTLVTVGVSFLSAAVLSFVPKKLTVSVSAIAVIAVILFNIPFFRPEKWFDITDADKFSGELWHLQVSAAIFDYLPIFAEFPPAGPPNGDSEIVEAVDAEDPLEIIPAISKNSNTQSYLLDQKNESILRINTFYYPGWSVYIDGSKSPLLYEGDPLARIHVKVPEGRHQVTTRFTNTPIRTIANLATLTSILYLLVKIKPRS